MNKLNKVNININKDDQNINDFLFCWSELGKRPSKNLFYNNYNTKKFLDFFDTKVIERSIQRDTIPFEMTDMVNERSFCKIDDSIWLSFVTYDIFNEQSFVGDVCFYYDYESIEKVDKYSSKISEFQIEEESNNSTSSSNLFSINVGQSGFELESIPINSKNFENIENFYNDRVIKKTNKVAKKIQKLQKGLTIIYGERGTGKTTLINYICRIIESKDFVFIPTTLFDNTINNSEFKNYLKKIKNSVIILDDSEIFFSDIYSKSNIFTNNILQLVDGLDSDLFGLHLILILNCGKEYDIDPHLMESNNLVDVIHIDDLQKDKVSQLTRFLKKKNNFKSPKKLIEVLKGKINHDDYPEMGF